MTRGNMDAAKKYLAVQEDMQRRIDSGKLGPLSLRDFWAAAEAGKKMVKAGRALVLSKAVAEYFGKFGFNVEKAPDGVNFEISE